MAKFCGGFVFDDTLKVDKGVITLLLELPT